MSETVVDETPPPQAGSRVVKKDFMLTGNIPYWLLFEVIDGTAHGSNCRGVSNIFLTINISSAMKRTVPFPMQIF